MNKISRYDHNLLNYLRHDYFNAQFREKKPEKHNF